MTNIGTIRQNLLLGKELTWEEAVWLSEEADKASLYQLASEITQHFGKPAFNPCSIINARSGKCSEDCKWCAQSASYKTKASVHDIVSSWRTLSEALQAEKQGVKRFCQVTSGRKVSGEALQQICRNFRTLKKHTGLYLCGSLGLLNKEELQELWNAGVRRYHCNLETAPSYFGEVCTSHTIEEKIETLRQAREIGFEICSGGIIGMGESRRQRLELAFKLRDIHPHSIPINLLCPIAGTPLESVPPISDEEILETVAMFRLIHPRAELRFAGGRSRLSKEVQLKALQIGINAAVVGNLLTTIGSSVEEDKLLAAEAGYRM